MLKQKVKTIFHRKRFTAVAVIALILVVVAGGIPYVRHTKAESIQEQIAALQAENAKNKSIVSQLREQAVSYQDAINQLQAQISTLQGQIDANTAEQHRLQSEIAAAEAELERQRNILGENIKTMYIEGQMSTLEMIASSKDLSDFVDKQQYRNTVQEKIKSTLNKITALKFELTAKKETVEKLLAEQQVQRSQLASNRAEQSNLLAYNKDQQAEFNQKTKDNQSRINALIASQRSANNATDGGFYFIRFPGEVRDFNGANYPYRNAGFSMQLGPCSTSDSYPDAPDEWGYCTRQCVSYTAWAVQASGRTAPRYYGNAKEWVGEAQARGIPVYRDAMPGDVAISTRGTWGHAMYVEEVSGNKARVSEYNQQLTGTYRNDRWISF